MYKEADYKKKIEIVSPWLVDIIDVVKKDLKLEHLKIDAAFCKRYFLGKSYQHLSSEELSQAYFKDIQSGNVGLGEFIATRWLLKTTDVYGFFLERLKSFNPDFESIQEIPDTLGKTLMQEAILRFGATKTFLFSLFNSVAFSDEIFRELQQTAEKERVEVKEKESKEEEVKTIDAIKKRYEREMAAMNDRFEKKLSGFQKKYLNDVSTLKKQMGQLQRKLEEPNDSTSG